MRSGAARVMSVVLVAAASMMLVLLLVQLLVLLLILLLLLLLLGTAWDGKLEEQRRVQLQGGEARKCGDWWHEVVEIFFIRTLPHEHPGPSHPLGPPTRRRNFGVFSRCWRGHALAPAQVGTGATIPTRRRPLLFSSRVGHGLIIIPPLVVLRGHGEPEGRSTSSSEGRAAWLRRSSVADCGISTSRSVRRLAAAAGRPSQKALQTWCLLLIDRPTQALLQVTAAVAEDKPRETTTRP